MLNHKSIIPDPIKKSALIFSTIKELKISTNKENHKIKNYSNLSLIYKEIILFMEPKINHNYLLILIKTLSIKLNETHLIQSLIHSIKLKH